MAKIGKAIVVLGFLLPFSAAANAGQSATGNIFGFQSFASGTFFFQTDGVRSGAPSCQNTNYPKRYVIDASTAGGQSILALVLTAYALHKPVYVVGTGNCSVASDAETLLAISTDGV